MKERITITLDPETLSLVDKTINGRDVRNRSHAIENILLRYAQRSATTALILAGGPSGEKAMLRVAGKPALEHQVEFLARSGIKSILIAAGASAAVQQYFGNAHSGVGISYVEEKRPAGTAGVLRLVKDRVKDTLVVMNGDTLMQPDIRELCTFHYSRGAMATMLLVTKAASTRYGAVRMRGSRITEFVEKPQSAETNLVSAGLYVFEPGVLDMAPKSGSLEKGIFPKLAASGSLAGFVHDGATFDVSRPEEYKAAASVWA